MKIYIAGAISENPNYIEQFAEAENKLISEGHAVINPVKNIGFEYKDYIDMGLCELMHCESIYLLEGYENSKGALLEKHYAEAVGMKILYQKKNWSAVFSEKVKDLMTEKRISQKKLAELCDTTEVSISRYISGKRVPNSLMIIKIANAFGCTVDDLIY